MIQLIAMLHLSLGWRLIVCFLAIAWVTCMSERMLRGGSEPGDIAPVQKSRRRCKGGRARSYGCKAPKGVPIISARRWLQRVTVCQHAGGKDAGAEGAVSSASGDTPTSTARRYTNINMAANLCNHTNVRIKHKRTDTTCRIINPINQRALKQRVNINKNDNKNGGRFKSIRDIVGQSFPPNAAQQVELDTVYHARKRIAAASSRLEVRGRAFRTQRAPRTHTHCDNTTHQALVHTWMAMIGCLQTPPEQSEQQQDAHRETTGVSSSVRGQKQRAAARQALSTWDSRSVSRRKRQATARCTHELKWRSLAVVLAALPASAQRGRVRAWRRSRKSARSQPQSDTRPNTAIHTTSYTHTDVDLEYYGTPGVHDPDLAYYGFTEPDAGSHATGRQRTAGRGPFVGLEPGLEDYGTIRRTDADLGFYGFTEEADDPDPAVGCSSTSPRVDEVLRFRPGDAPLEKSVIATYNVNGRMRLEGRGDARDSDDWGTGVDLKAEATKDWNAIERMIQGRAIIVLTELQVNGKQMQAIRARLAASGPWDSYGTPGGWNPTTNRISGGVLALWDERCYVAEHRNVIIPRHAVEVKLQDCRAGMVFTLIGAYMPGRGLKESTVRKAWEKLGTAVEEADPGRIIVGDLNAELTSSLQREGRRPTIADDLLQHLAGNEMLIEAGPEQATYECAGSRSQIDHILCDPELAVSLGEGRVLPGLSAHDHRFLEIELIRDADTHTGPARHTKPPLWQLTTKDWDGFAEGSQGAANAALALLSADAPPSQRLRTVEDAWTKLAKDWMPTRQVEARVQRPNVPGSGHRSAEERIRSDIGRWEALVGVITQRGEAHPSFLPANGHDRRRSFAKVKELQKIMTSLALSPRGRRLALLQKCQHELGKAKHEKAQLEVQEGDGFMEAMEEAIREGAEGGVQVRLFELLKMATGKGKKIKWRGQKQEGKSRWKGRGKPPIRLSSLYEGGDKAKGVVVTGAEDVLEETRSQAAAINGDKESFPGITRQLMHQLRPFPQQHAARQGWAKEVCTWERFERAVGRAGADVGVGSDGYSGYLTRKASLASRRLYFDIIRDMLEGHDFPPQWKLWECVLLMKPGEDPREFGRRRDVWLMPHSLKVAARMLMCEYEDVCGRYVPASQSGFSQDANAPSQTMVMKLHRERCREKRQGYYVAYADMGTYFMSICKEIMAVAEQWTGTRVEVSRVLLAMQEGLQGRVETAYGMTEPHTMPGVACGQGHECSPTRSKIMASFIQVMAQKVCRGYRFDSTGITQVWFADDSAYLCEDLAGLQMALDAVWVVARVAGLQVTVKAKDAETRVGSKTAWMGTYWDSKGKEREVTGWNLKLPDGTVVPQVRAYKYLGTPLQIEFEGRHDAMRKKVVGTCCALIRQIGRVDMLGPKQLRRGFELAMAGVLGYYCRSTPMTWASCQQIEAVRAEVMARRGICASTPRAAIYLTGEAGGAGHMHAYQYAAAAYIDQFHRALGGGLGEPVRAAVSERVAVTCQRLGCTQEPLTWHPAHLTKSLSEDHMVEAWLLMKLRAQMKGTKTGAMVRQSLGNCGVCGEWRERNPGTGPRCEASWCPGSKEIDESQDSSTKGPRDTVLTLARRTADCFGGWEYLLHNKGTDSETLGQLRAHGRWVHHTDMADKDQHQMQHARDNHRQSHSLRDLLETDFGNIERGSVGRMEIAIRGPKNHSQTEPRLAELVNVFITHAQGQITCEMGDELWPNLEEMPQKDGYRGSKWTDQVEPTISYYRGGKQSLPDGKQRSSMSLAGRPDTWEERLPVNLQVSQHHVTTAVNNGGSLPEGLVHKYVNYTRPRPPGSGPWRVGGGTSGYNQINSKELRGDPVTRLFLRQRAFEKGEATVQTDKGIEIACGEVNQAALYEDPHAIIPDQAQGDAESLEALIDVCLPLHYNIHFTHAAAVDGSMDDPRRRGGKGRKRVAYGVFEGVLPEDERTLPDEVWGSFTQRQQELHSLGKGLWGGALPRDWDNNDAEAYAIMRYLQSVVERSEDPSQQRVLVLSDSRAVLDVIETVWRSGDAALCKSRDRGAMIEAICEARRALQRVVFIWCPGHRGIVPNEYADMAAKAHLDAPIDMDVDLRIAKGVRTRDCLYKVKSEHEDDTWSIADRRCFKLARQVMGRWVRDELMKTVNTLRYDVKLSDGRRYNYGEGGYCTEVVKDFGEGRTVTPKSGIEGMISDCGRVGFVMGRRARDSGLPHERGYFRTLGRDLVMADDEAGKADDSDEECGRCDTSHDILTAAQRESRLGCPGCPRRIADTCERCSGWLGRPKGSAPRCGRQECPGNMDTGGWTVVNSRRHHVTLKIPSAQVRREDLKRDEDPQYSVRTQARVYREGDTVGGGVRSARTRQAQTTTERLRREGVRKHEDSTYDIGAPNQLADLQHVIGRCPGTPNRVDQLEELAFAMQDLQNVLPAGRGGTQEFRNLVGEACRALDAAANGNMQASEWESVDLVLSAMVPDFAREEKEVDRAGFVKDVISSLAEVHIMAAGILGGWKRSHQGEIKRRSNQERSRGILRLILRAWREETDGRKAQSLRGAKDWGMEEHAPSRMPNDCLASSSSSLSPRVHNASSPKVEADLWRKLTDRELKCEGGSGRLPGSRSALPAGSRARLLLTHIRLVEGGRLKACRDASKDGSHRRSAARGWRFGRVTQAQQAGWRGAPASAPEKDPLLTRVDDHDELRDARRLGRERRLAVDVTQGQAGPSQAHGVMAGGPQAEQTQQGTLRLHPVPVREPRKGKAVVLTPRVFKPGERVMYGTINTGWMEVTITEVDFTSVAVGEETAYTILIGGTERGTVSSKLREITDLDCEKHVVTSSNTNNRAHEATPRIHRQSDKRRRVITPNRLEDTRESVVEESDGGAMSEEGWMEEESGKGGEHLSDALDPELRDGGLIFERYTSKSDCSLTGWHKAGRGIVPWSEPGVGWKNGGEDPTGVPGDQSQEESQADPPLMGEGATFDRTRQVRSVPWRLNGARVRLVDCAELKLRDREGTVEGWESETGQVRVRVDGETVRVWSSEVVQIAAAVGWVDGERKRRTMSEPNSRPREREEGVKKMRYAAEEAMSREGVQSATQEYRVLAGQAANLGVMIEVTSYIARKTKRNGMRNVALAGIANDFRSVMRGVWKWAIQRSQQGVPQGGKRRKTDRQTDRL